MVRASPDRRAASVAGDGDSDALNRPENISLNFLFWPVATGVFCHTPGSYFGYGKLE